MVRDTSDMDAEIPLHTPVPYRAWYEEFDCPLCLFRFTIKITDCIDSFAIRSCNIAWYSSAFVGEIDESQSFHVSIEWTVELPVWTAIPAACVTESWNEGKTPATAKPESASKYVDSAPSLYTPAVFELPSASPSWGVWCCSVKPVSAIAASTHSRSFGNIGGK